MKKTLRMLLICLLILTVISENKSFAISDEDTENQHWAIDVIKKWEHENLLSEKDKENFRPDDKITRAEFMGFINKSQHYTEKSDAIKEYKDMKENHEHYKDVAIALKAGYINGVSKDSMAPDAFITREQAMAIFSRISDVSKNQDAYKLASDYSEVSDWAIEPVSTCIEHGFISGSNGKIMPKNNMTRAEAIVMLNRKLEDIRTFALAGIYDLANETVKNISILAKDIQIKNVTVEDVVSIKEAIDGKISLSGDFNKIASKSKNLELTVDGKLKNLRVEKEVKLTGSALSEDKNNAKEDKEDEKEDKKNVIADENNTNAINQNNKESKENVKVEENKDEKEKVEEESKGETGNKTQNKIAKDDYFQVSIRNFYKTSTTIVPHIFAYQYITEIPELNGAMENNAKQADFIKFSYCVSDDPKVYKDITYEELKTTPFSDLIYKAKHSMRDYNCSIIAYGKRYAVRVLPEPIDGRVTVIRKSDGQVMIAEMEKDGSYMYHLENGEYRYIVVWANNQREEKNFTVKDKTLYYRPRL